MTGFKLLYPVDHVRLTQLFAARPEYYKKFGLPGHEGVDFGVPVGTPVRAAAAGVIKMVDHPANHPYGLHVRITHEDGYETIYAHLSRVNVFPGETVEAGEAIGKSGNTGNSTGPHLHFTLKQKGATASGLTKFPKDVIDPTPYFT
jgi:murein DD-endopeptidase MepM/ murein hydrolase activator NlpD